MCTGIFIKTKDGKFIFARTLEFGVYLKWKQFCSLNIKGTIGHFDNVKEGFMTDGLNSNGLFVGTFFFPHNDKQYPNEPNVEGKNSNKSLFSFSLHIKISPFPVIISTSFTILKNAPHLNVRAPPPIPA